MKNKTATFIDKIIHGDALETLQRFDENSIDIVLDPFLGSGTTAKMALLTGRNYLGCDISDEYCEIARQRVEQAQAQQFLFGG